MSEDADVQLDVCGVCCPLPLIQLAKAIKVLTPGQTLQIVGNDPIFETAVRDFCQANRHTLLDVKAGDGRRVTILIKVGG